MRYLLVLTFVALLAGCIQPITRSTEVVDNRPGLTFEVSSEAALSYQLRINGRLYGEVGDYLVNENRLRLVDGQHQIELLSHGEIVQTDRVYLGAGVTRVIKVGTYD